VRVLGLASMTDQHSTEKRTSRQFRPYAFRIPDQRIENRSIFNSNMC
jgi:hypothetical protein